MHLSVLHRRGPRALLHLAAATTLATGSVLVTGGAGHAEGHARPDSFGGDATASALHVSADRNPQPTPVSDLFHVEVPYAISSFDSSGNATASAAQLYPGDGLLGAPVLLCQAGLPCTSLPPFPSYPLLTTASYPTTPDATAQASPGTLAAGPVVTSPGLATAHADASRVEATTKASGVGLSGQVTVDTAMTHSMQAFEGSTLVVTAESVLKGVDLAGGALHIDAIRSVAVSKVDGGSVTTSSAVTTVTGATANGTPVTIDSTGVHVAGQGDGGALAGGANTALAALDASGMKVRLTTPAQVAKDGAASASTGGVLVTFDRLVDAPSVSGAPPLAGEYFGSLTLAGAGVSAFASPAFPDVPVDVFVPPVAEPGAAPPVTAPVTPVVGGAPALVLPGTSGTSPTVSARRPDTRPVAVLGVDLSGERLKTLALVLLGYPLVVLLTAPFRLRPRRTSR